MNHVLLASRLQPVSRRRQRLGLWRRLSVIWAVAAIVGGALLLVREASGASPPLALPVVAIAAAIAALIVTIRHLSRPPAIGILAEAVEQAHPDLKGLLLTAVEQQPPKGGRLTYFQDRILREAVAHSHRQDWRAAVPGFHIGLAQLGHLAALALFIFVLIQLRSPLSATGSGFLASLTGLSVTPGDTDLERGTDLVVLARFGSAPPSATLIIGNTPTTERRYPLTRSLSDPVYGGSFPGITNSTSYRIEYDGKLSRAYRVNVFEFPRLERADADLNYPEYTALPPKRIEDTRRITAVEGTRLDLALQFNKPVASAKFVAREAGATDLPLTLATHGATAQLLAHPLLTKAAYDLLLVDDEGRTNKVPTQFTFDVVPNRTPELKLATPRGDQRPSALEELSFTGTAWDDFGMPSYGLGFNLVGQDTRFVELGTNAPAGEKRPFQSLLRLEDFGLQPDDLVSWFVWADDIGPDGQIRRTSGDLFFGEIRPFEEVFREASNSSGQQQQEGEQGGQGSPTTQLAELQKQIVNATWKLRRTYTNAVPAYAKDASVVRDSQAQARARAQSQRDETEDPRAEVLWDNVLKEMDGALARLSEAETATAALAGALSAEQAAYQALLKLQARETNVARGRQSGQGQAGQARNQRQLDELELAEAENRYETQRDAQSANQNPERREQLQIVNRLQELARRQEDVNEQLKELQTALQEANTEADREEIRRRLKRLQEEQQRMLADMDELQQRMQRPENQSRTGEQQRQLDQARQDMQRSSEATGQGSVSQALAAGSRAEQQLEQTRDQLRRESAGEFAEDLRDMRAQARELARQQEALQREITAPAQPARPSLSTPTANEDLAERVADQKNRFTNLVNRATQLSQAAESSEPLVSRQLYDTLRDLAQNEAQAAPELQTDLVRRGLMTPRLYERMQQLSTSEQERAKSLELTAEMLRQGYEAQAGQAGNRARTSIERLRKGVERAAENVLGDDTEALRLAQSELQSLVDQVEREIASAAGTNLAASGAAGSPSNPQETGAGQNPSPSPGQGQESAQGQGQQGQSGQDQPGQGQGQGQAQSQGQAPGQGQGQGQGQGPSPSQAQAQTSGQGQGQQPGAQRGGREGGEQSGTGGGNGGTRGNNRRAGFDFNRLLSGNADTGGGSGPISGESFAPWSDRLREVEEMIDLPELRSDVATARERARLVRQDLRQDLKKPDWAVVRTEVVGPLVEVRSRIQEELARRGSGEGIVPIDRDPVPTRFSELVRRYYEELGKDR